MAHGIFPFGKPLYKVEQTDRQYKDIFVLGVYSSAVHAKWLDNNNRIVVQALAVASEPYIFWRGDGAKDIIADIEMPEDLGRLVPANHNLNGPSGKALDEFYLHPLGFDRSKAWLCDLVPHSCLNPNQEKAIQKHYNPLVEEYNLPKVDMPQVPKILANEQRKKEILHEIETANPRLIVLLGDEPIRWFLNDYLKEYKRLKDFGYNVDSYGRIHTIRIKGKLYYFLPLIHPRQAAGLGNHSKELRHLHRKWMDTINNKDYRVLFQPYTKK